MELAASHDVVASFNFCSNRVVPRDELSQQNVFDLFVVEVTALGHDHQVENPRLDLDVGCRHWRAGKRI